ncbi:MAG: hypothetical protein IPL08_06595 [Saprospiraceae bacterium]|nr:hypothetical protein [Saprospiraceae bacterium]
MKLVVPPQNILKEALPSVVPIDWDHKKLPAVQLGVGAQNGGADELSGLQV